MFDQVISQSQQFWSHWSDLWRERLESATEEAARQQRTQAERTSQFVDETAALTKTSIERSMAMADQWRTMSLDAWRRGFDMMKVPESTTAEG